jgi:hypothetical protein
MDLTAIAMTKLPDLLQAKTQGETVNPHVVTSVKEPEPDFSAMQRLLSSSEKKDAMHEPTRNDA